MKICMISHAFPPGKLGGAEIYVQRIVCALAKKGRKVVIITQAPYGGLSSLFPKKSTKDSITFYSFYPLNIFSIYEAHRKPFFQKGLWRIIDLLNPLPAFLIWSILKKEKPDIVHSHIIHGFSPLFLLRFIKKLKIPIVQTIHSYGFFCLRCDLLKPSGDICAKKPIFCQLFIYISKKLVDSIPNVVISPSRSCLKLHTKSNLFVNSEKVVLPPGMLIHDSKSIEYANGTSGRNCFNILCAGRLVKNKGFQILIKAFKKLTFENVRLYIIGEGNYKKHLQCLANNDTRIIFPGKLDNSKLSEYYQMASVVVIPSIYEEPFGMVIIESFSWGIAVIGSKIGGIPEIIKENYNGYLFEPGNSYQLKGILEHLIKNPQELKRLGENALKSSKEYGIEKHLSRLEKIYVQATNTKP